MAKSALDIYYEAPDNKRGAYRALVTDILVRVEGKSGVFPARDLSPTGVGIGGGGDFAVGEPVLISLYQRSTLIIEDLIARTARVDKDVAGLYFENLDKWQADVIHAIVLLIQKEQLEQQNFHPFFLH